MAEGHLVNITIVTGDPLLLCLCHDVLREYGEGRCRLSIQGQGGPASDCDICIWDCTPGVLIEPGPPGSERKDLYLVSSTDLPAFQQTLSQFQGHILLKPVARAILQTFLELALPSRSRVSVAEFGAVRADRDELLQSLLFANVRLQEFNQQRTNFISRAVHDFRAPLTALSGFCGLLSAEQLGPLNAQQKDALQGMQRSAERLLRMSSSMFELSVSRHVDRTPTLENADISRCIEQAVHELRPAADEKCISIGLRSIVPPTGPLYFEPSQIEQVLINLLDNACKVTPAHGSVELCGYPYFWERRFVVSCNPAERRRSQIRTPNAYRIDVKDTGTGIPPEQLERIFEEYTTCSKSDNGYGCGLGLAICRLILDRHRGKVWADNGRMGAVLSFVLPYRQEARAETQNRLENAHLRGVSRDQLKTEDQSKRV